MVCVRDIAELVPSGTTFIVDIVGRIDEQKTYKRALELLAAHGTTACVRFHGEVSHMDAYSAARILVYPSR
jgi:cytosine/adenosine deaminase-related metal-dependent hydrolase